MSLQRYSLLDEDMQGDDNGVWVRYRGYKAEKAGMVDAAEHVFTVIDLGSPKWIPYAGIMSCPRQRMVRDRGCALLSYILQEVNRYGPSFSAFINRIGLWPGSLNGPLANRLPTIPT